MRVVKYDDVNVILDHCVLKMQNLFNKNKYLGSEGFHRLVVLLKEKLNEIVFEINNEHNESAKMKKINLNSFIYVKLTDYGRQVYIDYHENIISQATVDSYKKRYVEIAKRVLEENTNSNGYSEFQLHEFMNIFGSHMYTGSENVVENVSFYIKDSDIEEEKKMYRMEKE